jgi:hypothetical protein
VGNGDKAVSPFYKVWIRQGDVTVCGVIGEGTSKEIQSNWESPFEGESAEGKWQKTAGISQDVLDGVTTITTYNSRQTWAGNAPTQFSLTLRFYALSDARTEVMEPLRYLETFAAPQVKKILPLDLAALKGGETWMGRVPQQVLINIGRRNIYPNCVIESVSQPWDGERDSKGNLVRAEVQLQVATIQLLNRDEIASRYNG